MRQLSLSSVQRLLRLPRLRDVHHRADHFLRARDISYKVREDMQVLDPPVRHEQSVLLVEFFLAMHRAIDVVLHNRAVVGMGPLHDDIERRLDPTLEAHDLVSFLGPIRLAGECFPAKGSSETELLRLRQISLAALQGTLGPLSILNIGVCAVPSHNISCLVAKRRRTKQEPAVFSIEAPHPRLDLLCGSARQHVAPAVEQSGEIRRMYCGLPLPAESSFNRQTGIVEPALVQILGVSVGSRLPRESRDSIQRELKLMLRFGKVSLTLSQCEFRALPILDVVA